MKYTKKVFSLLLISFLISSSVYAQSTSETANGFRISPVRNEITIEKGKTESVIVNVENPSGATLKAKALINDFIASDKEDGEPRLLLNDDFAPSHSFKRIASTTENIELGPKERKDIKVNISVPANAKAGGYYGAIRFAAITDGQSNLSLTASVASLFLVSVPGNIKEKIDIVGFSAGSKGEGKSFITRGDVSIITRIANSGDIHEQPFGKIIITDSKGKIVSETEFNNTDPKSNILPDSTRKFENVIKNKKWFGHYTATISLGYGTNSSELATAKTSFWYIPVWLIVVLGMVLVALIAISFMFYQKMKSHNSRNKRNK
jgi:hypothetical protein